MQSGPGHRHASRRSRARILTKIIMMVEAPEPTGASGMPIKIVNIQTIVIRQITGSLENSGGTASTAKIVSRLSWLRKASSTTGLPRHL